MNRNLGRADSGNEVSDALQPLDPLQYKMLRERRHVLRALAHAGVEPVLHHADAAGDDKGGVGFERVGVDRKSVV